MGAVAGRVAGRDGDTGFDARVPHAVHDLPADLLGQAGVEGAAHAASFHRAQVFDIDHTRTGSEGLADRPAGSGPGQGVVSLFTLDPDVTAMAHAPLVYRLHALLALALFALWPFGRLVHAFAAPLGYPARPYVVYRSRGRAAPSGRTPRRSPAR